MRKTLSATLALAMVILAGTALAAEQAKKPHIVILATGGTLAGSKETQTRAGYTSGQVGVDVLLKLVLLKTSNPTEVQSCFNRY